MRYGRRRPHRQHPRPVRPKTVVTFLENAGVLENVSADIVGHEKPRITYGLYSGGASLEVKRAALERPRYAVAVTLGVPYAPTLAPRQSDNRCAP